MKGNLYKRPVSYRRMYFNIDICISTIRANVTYILVRTHTHIIPKQVYRSFDV